jgi:hypothetical protein
MALALEIPQSLQRWGFVSLTVSFQPGHYGPHRRHHLGDGATTTDHEGVPAVDDVSVEPALMPQHFPSDQESTHINV